MENCQNIRDLANTNLASLAAYGVTAAKLTAWQTAITAFSGRMGKPRRGEGENFLWDVFPALPLRVNTGLISFTPSAYLNSRSPHGTGSSSQIFWMTVSLVFSSASAS